MIYRNSVLSLFLLTAGVCYGQPVPKGAAVYATGLQSPRGLAFGPDGLLYVAEAGTGGQRSSANACPQVVPPVGPYTGGVTGRVSSVSANGTLSTVVTGLPSSQDAMGDLMGVSAVAFVGPQLYALVAGGGCSHGDLMPNGVYAVNQVSHSAQLLADLSTFFHNNPVSHPNAGDFEPDGVPYSMIEANGELYVVEPNHGRLLRITTDGEIHQISDFSATLGHVVPTSVVWEYGQFWIGNLGLFPVTPQSESVYQLARKGCIVDHIAGLTAITGMATDGRGALYVLQFSTVAGYPSPGTGNLVRIVDGIAEVVLSELIVPTAVTVGPDGAVYVSDLGAAPMGRILRIVPPPIGQGTHLAGVDSRLHVDSGSCAFSPKAGQREEEASKR